MAYSPETHIIEYNYCGKVKLAKPYCERFERVLEANRVPYEVVRYAQETQEHVEQELEHDEINLLDIVVYPSGLRGVVIAKYSGSFDVLRADGVFQSNKSSFRVIGNVSTFI